MGAEGTRPLGDMVQLINGSHAEVLLPACARIFQ
eukprot:CAMPEP_0179020802 /NCGR_PEP_ID=MMETSP0796-20121207/5563_1 /TAXON_ID=73915 /ORGANISM="Pyrodinium bahamense, Strain pbaha01" /LENGTH=33 /DNA_ID= /DNA_START= /DNA_END= /DNA_ORIENTATION=